MAPSIAQAIAHRVADAESRNRAGEFIKLAQLVATRGTDLHDVEFNRATDRVQRVLKTVVAPMGMSTDISPDQQALGEAFVNSLVGTSVFDTLLANGARRVPLKTHGIIISTAPTGDTPNGGEAKTISEMSLTGSTLDPRKSWAAVAASRELLDFSRSGAQQLFATELRTAVIRATDAALLSQLVAATMPTASVGATFASVLVDLAALLAAVDIQPTSRVYLVITTARAKVWALMLTAAGGLFAFPGLTVTGGTIAGGIEVIASESLPTNRSLMVVADGLIGNSLPFELRQIRQGDIQLTTPPNSPSTAATVLRGMWQNNIQALTIERYWAMEPVRAKSLASLSH